MVPVHGADARREPLCAWYAAETLHWCRSLLRRGERRAGALFDALTGADCIGDVDLERFGDASRLFTSVDTPERLAELGGTLEA